MPQTLENRSATFAKYAEPLIPTVSLLAVFIPIAAMRPNVLGYSGLTLLLGMVIPVIFATLGQMMAMSIGEIDFSLENLVSLVACVIGAVMPKNFWLAIAMLAGIVVVYALIGLFVHLRNLPSIIVTIGMSFIWYGVAIAIQPKPGGTFPKILSEVMRFRPPHVPLPILAAAVLALIGYIIMNKTYFGILCRGVGGNVKSISQAGHSVLRVRMTVFAMVAVFGILSGLALAGLTNNAEALAAKNYTLLAVASVILGGGTFSGGKVSAVGAVQGALVMYLVNSLLIFAKVSPDWQVGTQGAIIIAVLFIGGVFKRGKKIRYI